MLLATLPDGIGGRCSSSLGFCCNERKMSALNFVSLPDPGFSCSSPQNTELAQLSTLKVWSCSIPWDQTPIFCTVGSDKCSTNPGHSIPLSCSEFGAWALPTCDPIPPPTDVPSWSPACPLQLKPIRWGAIGVGHLQKRATCVQIC